jgi:hypothetical protein
MNASLRLAYQQPETLLAALPLLDQGAHGLAHALEDP